MQQVGYGDKERKDMVAEVNQILTEAAAIESPDKEALEDEAYAMSMQLAKRLRREQPGNFRVFFVDIDLRGDEVMPFNNKHGWKDVASGPGARSGRAEEFKNYERQFGLKQDDIVIFRNFHRTMQHLAPDIALYVWSDGHASALPIWNTYQYPPYLQDTLNNLGLTAAAAQWLWFPKNDYAFFGHFGKERPIDKL